MNAQSRLVEENLRRLRVPYRIIGGKSFFDRREVKDVLAYASCLLNVDDDVALLRIVNTPARGISDDTVEKATQWSITKGTSVFKALRDADFLATLRATTRDSIEKFATFLDDFETKLHEPLSNQPVVLRNLIKDSGYLADLQRTCKTPEEWLDREKSVNEVVASFEQFEGRSDKGLQGFLDEMMLRQEREEDKDEEDAGGVTLITLHASKGLEYPHVYLMGVEEGVLPHDRSKVEGTVDEERRLLYVGITRAQRTLSLTWCRQRMKYGSAMPCIASSFLKEFDPELVEHKDVGQILNAPVAEAKAAAGFDAIFAMLGKI
jgi:DNA helicase II / ATP-dependent DNA helicase PcrA